jgi:predicted ribosome quality control (RQC) complex YloA/Tae2 family protein
MDRKRAMTSVDLAALVGELGAYTGAVVDKAYLYGEDLVRLKMRDYDRGRIELIVEAGDPKRAHVAAQEHVPDAPGRPPNFAMMLRNRIAGATLESVEQYGFDRILTFRFEREDQTTLVVAELFGDGNVAVTNADREVIDCLDTVRLRSRTVAPGNQYGYPDERFSPLECDYEAFAARMDDSDTDLVRTLATQLNFGGLYAEELCSRADVEKTVDIEDATDRQYEALFDALERLREPILAGDTDPRLYEEHEADRREASEGASGEAASHEADRREASEGASGEAASHEADTVVDATPLPLEEHAAAGYDATAFENFNDALDEYFYRLQQAADDSGEVGSDRPDFEAELEKHERIIQQQRQAIEDFETRAETEQAKAELLYGHYDLVDEVCSTVRDARVEGVPWDEIETTIEAGAEQGIPAAEAVRDVDAAEGTVTIELDGTAVTVDPSMGVEKNADRLYTEAKRIREKKAGAQAAIEDTREDLEAVKRRRDEWAADDDPDDESEATERDWLGMESVPVRSDDQWYERFRWVRTSDDFLVLGGRNADQNEELVKKYMEPSDRFFHADAHGAPVTILKATEPDEPARDVDIPDGSRAEAARLAVSYSSVWKEGRFEGDAYEVDPDQVSKTPESGEYVGKGSFVVRGDREYYRDVPVGVAVGITCEPDTRVVGGPPSAVEPRAETAVRLEPGRYAQNDIAKRLYRTFRERFRDTSFVRKVASPDLIQEFCPAGGSRMVDE